MSYDEMLARALAESALAREGAPLTGLEPASAMPVRLEIAARLYAGEILHSGLPWDCDAEDAHIDAALTIADRLIAAHNATLAKEGQP